MASYKYDNANKKKINIQKQNTVSGCCFPVLNLGPRDIIIQIFGLSYINAQYFGEMKPDNTQYKSLKLNCLYIYVFIHAHWILAQYTYNYTGTELYFVPSHCLLHIWMIFGKKKYTDL